jgi:hypothetical protein
MTKARIAASRKALAAALFFTLLPLTVRAESDAEREKKKGMARQIGQQAQEAFDKKDYKTSEDLFARAESLYHAPTLALGLARSYAQNGKLVLAQETYNRMIREDDKPGAPAIFQKAVADAKSEIGAVSARIAQVVIRVVGPAEPTVTLDNEPFPNAALGVKSPVDPGSHVVKANARGYAPAEAKFSVADAGNAETVLTLEKSAEAVAANGTPPATGGATTGTPPSGNSAASGTDTGEGGGGGSSLKMIGVAAAGVGAAGLVFGAITGALALGKHGDLAKVCTNGTCDPNQKSNLDSYHSMATLSTVGFVVGGVGLAAGAVLFLAAPKPAEKSAWIAPVVGLGSVGAVGEF